MSSPFSTRLAVRVMPRRATSIRVQSVLSL